MQLQIRDNLPFVEVSITHNGKSIESSDILVYTGSGGTILAADIMFAVGIIPQAEDILHTIFGVGGSEVVFTRKIDMLSVGTYTIHHFEVEVGGMDYGFNVKGILGMDFLIATGAQINLHEMKIDFTKSS